MSTTYTGQSGVIKMAKADGTVTSIAEVTAFSVEHTVNTIEATAMGDQYREYKTGVNEWSGSADVFLANVHITDFAAITVGNGAGVKTDGSAVAIEAYPGGETATFPKLTGNVIVTGFSVSSEMEGMVTATISFQGTGALALTAVSA